MNRRENLEIPGGRGIRRLPERTLGEPDLNPSLFYQKLAERYPAQEDDERQEAEEEHLRRLLHLRGWLPSGDPNDLVNFLHTGALERFRMKTAARLLIGRGMPSVFEQAIGIHPLFGVPFLPGSAIKGVTRHWAEDAGKPDAEIERVFGKTPSEKDEEGQEGLVVFYDAYPLSGTCLEAEVLAPHYPDYYSKKKQWPSDEEGPNVLKLPAIKAEVEFQFALGIALARRSESNAEEYVRTTKEWVQTALREYGIGAKTSSNYGYFE